MKIHAIDYFCKLYDLSLGELAEKLNIKQPQINDWKRGRRNIPEKHKEAMYELFSIPISKRYLLEVDNLSEIDKKEIFILKNMATLDNEPVDSLIVKSLILEIDANKKEIEVLKLMDKLRKKIFETHHINEKYKSNIEKVNQLLNELE